MSVAHDHGAALAQLEDPTNTQGIRERFLRDIRTRFRPLRGAIREAVGYETDILGLSETSSLADLEDVERFESDSEKVRAFARWLREMLRADVLEAADTQAIEQGQHWTATYIRSAYGQGWENAAARLQQRGFDVDARVLQRVFNMGVPERQLRRLYTRTFENLESVTEDTVVAVRETLTEGLAAGWNPRKMARELTEKTAAIQRTQAEVLARTETINSYSTATLDRYERAQVNGVTVSGEFATAADDDVCPLCESIAGSTYAVEEMREATFEFSPTESEPDHLKGTYPVRPPVHPQCRCAILPVVG